MYDYVCICPGIYDVCIHVLECIHIASYLQCIISGTSQWQGDSEIWLASTKEMQKAAIEMADAFCHRGLTFGSTSVMHSCKTMLTLTSGNQTWLGQIPNFDWFRIETSTGDSPG